MAGTVDLWVGGPSLFVVVVVVVVVLVVVLLACVRGGSIF